MESAFLVCSSPNVEARKCTCNQKKTKTKKQQQQNASRKETVPTPKVRRIVHYINSHETFVSDKATNGPGIKLDHECHVQPADMSRSRLLKLPTERISFNADVYKRVRAKEAAFSAHRAMIIHSSQQFSPFLPAAA